MKFDINDFNDPKVWDLICSGKTKGIFQLESNLGRHWSKQLQPKNISELSALISLIRPGCVSGDTKISVKIYNRKDGHTRFKYVKIKDLYKYKEILSIDSDYNFTMNTVQEVFYTGDKECFNVKIHKRPNRLNTIQQPLWYNLECTLDHQFLRSDGEWIELQYLERGDRIAVVKRHGGGKMRHNMVANRHSPKAPKVKNTHGLKYFKEICYKNYEYKCCICGWNKASLDAHHIEGNRFTDNSVANLAFLCPNCHRLYDEGHISKDDILIHRSKYKLPNSNNIEWVTFMGYESVGIKPTYDISMSAPNHNFIAGNFVVHNCLKAFTDGKSMTQHYVDRKAGKDQISYPHESLSEILQETCGVLVYQEQSMMIAQKLAGFTLKEADSLRKAIGKKNAALMAEVKKAFIEGAKNLNIVTEEVASEIFSWIEKSNRYSFNKSHGISYAINAYWSAYCKYWKPVEFYVSYLNHADRKPDSQKEIKELIIDAKSSDIEVYPPRLNHLYNKFTSIDSSIYYGLNSVKNVGETEANKVISIAKGTNISNYTWLECLINIIYAGNINKRAVISLISIGAFNGKNNTEHRKRMLYEYDSWKQLSAREQEYISKNYKSFKSLYDCIEHTILNFKLTAQRKQALLDINKSIKDPFYNLEDTITSIAQEELKYMGYSLTCNQTDETDIGFATNMCKDISNGLITGKVNIVVNINSVRAYKTKRGKNPGQLMAFICGEDGSGMIDSITIFPEAYAEYKDLLTTGNIVHINGEISKKDKTSLIVNKVTQA